MRLIAFAIIAAAFLFVFWRSRSLLGFQIGDALADWLADALTWIRCWTWRKLILQFGLYFIAIGQRLMEIGQRPETPSGAKLRVSIAKQWEKSPIEMWNDGDKQVFLVGGRIVPFKR